MANLTRDFFIALSNNASLNKGAKKWGFRFGAEQFVAGTNLNQAMQSVKKLNAKGISCTVDVLGEFVDEKLESLQSKEQILATLERIDKENIACHLSVKLTQLGLDIDQSFCLNNMRDILETAKRYDIFVNIDTEDYSHYDQTLDIFHDLRKDYDHVGTVIQSYLYRAEADMDLFKDVRLRIVKGAYKESGEVAYQTKQLIDRNFIKLAKKRLKGDAFTSIATHDHKIIDEIKAFVERENIDHNKFEFQMLYGFRTDMQEQLAKEGYNICTYLPFGDDWFGYFMRRLAERPQNLNLIIKNKLYTEDNKLKKTPIVTAGVISVTTLLLLLRKKKK